jgi:hypothetical protein
MALVYCTRCGHRVSTTAPKCPNCGAPPYRNPPLRKHSGPTVPSNDDTTVLPPIPNRQAELSRNLIPRRRNTLFIGWQLPISVIAIAALLVLYAKVSVNKFSKNSEPKIVSLCTETPSFVKEVEMNHQGADGLDVWFTLADEGSRETCADGIVTITISATQPDFPPGAIKLYESTRAVKASDFAEWEFSNKLTEATSTKLIWESGRIPYSNLSTSAPLWGLSSSGYVGRAEVAFQLKGGTILRGRSEPTFDLSK